VCGIAGCYQQADGQKLVDVMSARIAHRGPDAAGTWSYENDRVSAQFGHRRLSIIDLSAAADQPLSKHGMTIVYNGELYNYRALRTELTARGVRFTTNSDTEVVLESWRTWGPDSLPSKLFHCSWCMSIWIAAPVMPVAALFPNRWVIAILAIPAASYLTGFLANREDGN